MGTQPITGWFHVEELGGGLTRITEPFVDPYFSANLYLVRGRDADLLVDSGMGIARLADVVPRVRGRPLIAAATHIHLDHVGSLHEFAHRWGPSYSADSFATMPDEKTYAQDYRALSQPVSRQPWEGWTVQDYRIEPAPLTRSLSNGDTVELGDRVFRVLHLPGHSPDSIGFLDEADGLFFSGDAIYDDELLDGLPDSDRDDYRGTMMRIAQLPIRLGLGGHGPVFDGARMRTIARAYLER